MQLRLLRFLQEKTFTPVGQDTPVKVDVRVVAATNVDLQEKVKTGGFREDLYYRLKVVEITIPPLRRRLSSLPALARYFISYFSKKHNLPVYSLSDQAMKALHTYSWPGNVRQFRHIIERGCVMCGGTTIQLEHLPDEFHSNATESSLSRDTQIPADTGLQYYTPTLSSTSELDMLKQALAQTGGNKAKAARILGIDRSTLYRKLKRYSVINN
jgi:DNA-binding NtrC family response regulator